MCGRYYFSKRAAEETAESWNLDPRAFSSVREGDVTPGADSAVLTAEQTGPAHASLHFFFWGFRRKEGPLVINARSETAAVRPLFAESIRSMRCVIPAASFYETDREKTRVRFFLEDCAVLYLAGIYRREPQKATDGSASFVILTREANASMLPFHDRMPLLLTRNEAEQWLDPCGPYEALLKKKLPMLANDRKYRQLSLFD